MTMVRGSNPIWYEVDLTAHAFDDTFYMFVLDNEIPYGPLPTWQDPFGNIVWDNPIRFLANGTLPNNVYFDPDVVYRLEFRQGNTQSDPLVYLVENYVPGSSGETPVDEVTFSTDNQITNPQFTLLNFISPLTLTSISSQSINIAPGWTLNLTGTGDVTLTQVLLNSATVDPTNASYALKIQLSGSWTNAYLSQRFTRNGILWSNTFVSSSITALYENTPQNISALLKDSQGNTLATVLTNTPLTEIFNEYRGVGQILSSADTDFPPTAYIEYQLLLPNVANLTVTSVQLISGDVQIEYPYEQTTIERQIDHTFHYYQPQLNFKPIPSLLTGWDFPLNPAQFGSSKTGSPTAAYIWDQTICQSAVGDLTIVADTATDALSITTTNNLESFYLLQYLQGSQALETTFSNLSVNLFSYTSANNVTATVQLFYSSANGTIPTLSTTIGTITYAGGFALTGSNGWTTVPQFLGYSNSIKLPTTPMDSGFSGFNGKINYASTSTTENFAIVVTFKVPTTGTVIKINSISSVPGDVPTRPAPQTLDEVLRECRFYYNKSFLPNVVPAQNVGVGTGETFGVNTSATTSSQRINVQFSSPLRVAPISLITLYNPGAMNAQIYNETSGVSLGSTSITSSSVSANSFSVSATGSSLFLIGDLLGIHWTADARLGVI